MGDYRASVIIKLVLWGNEYFTDMWINYFPSQNYGLQIDDRVIEFFEESYRDAIEKKEDAEMSRQERDRLKEKELRRQEYLKLKEEFDEK